MNTKFLSIRFNGVEILRDISNAMVFEREEYNGTSSWWKSPISEWIELKLVVNSQIDFVSKYYQFFKEKYFKIELQYNENEEPVIVYGDNFYYKTNSKDEFVFKSDTKLIKYNPYQIGIEFSDLPIVGPNSYDIEII